MQCFKNFTKLLAMDISPLQKFYHGFLIKEPVGNNGFSYDRRQNKSLFVPPLISGKPDDLKPGTEIAFCEIEDGTEKARTGLKNFIYFTYANKDVFIFDNHNHAFFFWLAGRRVGSFCYGIPLIHIDQHTDMRLPEQNFPFTLEDRFSLQQVFDYTNWVLNVGNFIRPALNIGLFTQVKIIDSSISFQSKPPEKYVLDIDMDIFSEDMAYIPFDFKLNKIRSYLKKAQLITIATSPYFMNQEQAVEIIPQLFTANTLEFI